MKRLQTVFALLSALNPHFVAAFGNRASACGVIQWQPLRFVAKAIANL